MKTFLKTGVIFESMKENIIYNTYVVEINQYSLHIKRKKI